MAFDPSTATALDEPPKSGFDPSTAKPQFDPTTARPSFAAKNEDEALSHGSASAQSLDSQGMEDAYSEWKRLRRRSMGEKAKEINPAQVGKSFVGGLWDFGKGLLWTTPKTAVRHIAAATGLSSEAPETLQAQETLAAQSGEESARKIGRVIGEAISHPVDTVGLGEMDEESLRRLFNEKIAEHANAQQLAQGIPLNEGVIADLYRMGNTTPMAEVSPEALRERGAEQADLEDVRKLSAASDPLNVVLAGAPGLPGAAKVGGAITEGLGKVAKLPGAAAEALGARIPTAAKIAANLNPATAAKKAGANVAIRGLKYVGEALESQGKELRTGAPSELTQAAANAALEGKSAIGANIKRAVGDTTARGAATAAGMAPVNYLLSEGDPEKFAELEAGAAGFGAIGQALSRNRPLLVEAVRPKLREEGMRSMREAAYSGDQLAQQTHDYVSSLPEQLRNTVLETMGAYQGLPGGAGPSKLYVLNARDFAAADAATSGGQTPMGGARGFFFGPDGAAYINGEYHSGLPASELAHTIGHEFGGHTALNLLRAMGAKGGKLYAGLLSEVGRELMPNGRPTADFLKFIHGYNKAFGSERLNWRDKAAMDEFLSEQAGQILASKGAAELALPESIRDKIDRGVARYVGKMFGVDTRLIGTETKFNRKEIGALTDAMEGTLRGLAGMKLREGAAGPLTEPQKTIGYRIRELENTLAEPRPTPDRPLVERQEWNQRQKAARKELATIQDAPAIAPESPVARPNEPGGVGQPPATPQVSATPQINESPGETPSAPPQPTRPSAAPPAPQPQPAPKEIAPPRQVATEVAEPPSPVSSPATKQGPPSISEGERATIARNLGEHTPEAQQLYAQARESGTPLYIRYRSATSAGDQGMNVRRDEYKADPAEAREQGTEQVKVIIPVETKEGARHLTAFVPDNVLSNARNIFRWLDQTGRRNPYGSGGTEAQGRLLIQDAQVYALNHQNGYRGDGSGPISQFPDTGLPRVNPGYQPQVIPRERFDILNAAMHSDSSSRLGALEARAREKQAAGKNLTPTEAERLAKARETINLARKNQRWVDPESGETNQLRYEMRKAGVDIADAFKSPFENLLPRNILEVSGQPIEGATVRPTDFTVDPAEAVKFGKPQDKAVAANFMPTETIKDDLSDQATWLSKQSKSMGYDSPEQLSATDPDSFNQLARIWRVYHPRDERGMMLQDRAARGINSALHGNSQEANSPRSIAGTREAFRDAASNLGGGDGGGRQVGQETGDQWTARASGERAALANWAKANGLEISNLPEQFKPSSTMDKGGQEHHAWFDPKSQRWIKATRGTGNGMGLKPILNPKTGWDLGYMTPAEYMESRRLWNEAMGDDIRVHAIWNDGKNISVITSQPNIKGEQATDWQIAKAMESRGFSEMGSGAFYRKADNLAIFDLHHKNAKIVDGVLIPFDGTAIHPSEELVDTMKWLKATGEAKLAIDPDAPKQDFMRAARERMMAR